MSKDPREIEQAISEYYGSIDHELQDMNPAQKFLVLVLWQAQRDRATELVIDPAEADGLVPIRYQVGGAWYEMVPFPDHIRAEIVQTVIGLAGAGNGDFPFQGEIDENVTAAVHLRWHVSVAAADALMHFQRA